MKSQVAELAREMWADLASPKAFAALFAGGTSGLGLLVSHIAFATFIFSGPLAQYASWGVGLVLFGAFAALLVMALAGGFRGTIAGLSPALVIGMGVIASTMDATGDALFVSAVVALILCAVITGVFCLIVGCFRVANVVRFVPYPVAAGFVAGIGGAVCVAALSLMATEPGRGAGSALSEPAMLWRWAPGVVYGLVLYWAMKRWRNPLILPVSVAIAVGAYHLALDALDISGIQARDMGLLLSSTGGGDLWPALLPADLVRADWGRDRGADSQHDRTDCRRIDCGRHEYRRAGSGGEPGTGLEPGIPGGRGRERGRGLGRGNRRDYRRAGVAQEQAAGRGHPLDRGGGRHGDRRRAVFRRRDAGTRADRARRRDTGLCGPRHARRGHVTELQAASLDRVRNRRAHLRRNHRLRAARRCRRGNAGDSRVLCGSAQPHGPRRVAFHGPRTAEQQGPFRAGPRHSARRGGPGAGGTDCAATSSSAASVGWRINCGRPWAAHRSPGA